MSYSRKWRGRRGRNESGAWREVFGTEAEQPEEFDTTASPTTVYQRRNIKKATKEDADGKKITGWQREEREMSREEYDRLTLMQEVVASNTTGIVESVTQFQKDAVIDEYTQQLIEEGFTWLARVISFEAFSMMVDEALERMKKMLESNKAMQTLVSGEAGETVEKDM